MIAYDNGYSIEFATNTIQTWDSKIKEHILQGMHFLNIGEKSISKRVSVTASIEEAHPGYLHDLYRDATTKIGNNAGFDELAAQMVLSSTSCLDNRPNIDISAYQLRKWFYDNNGKEISSFEKPLDTKEHCNKRKEWVIDHYGLLTSEYIPVAYLDEKWFFHVN